MDQKLKNAVIRKVGGKTYLKDVYNHGADAGFPGFIYYADTVKFYRKYRGEINEMAKEIADSMGESTISMVKSFRCLNNDYSEDDIAEVMFARWKDDNHFTQIGNALAWFALEETAREIFDK